MDLLDDYHNTPLTFAAFLGHVKVVRLLLEHKAEANSQDKKGRTPLHDAIRGSGLKADRLQMVQLLLKHGANANTRNHKQRTPLHLVSKRPDLLDVLRILLEYGPDLDAEDKDGKTSLQLSLDRDHHEVTRLLSEYSTTKTISR
jgi:ankyrin repeat protein